MKNIVLLSDGTGNGAAKRHKTDVWRLYNALNLHCDDQIANYDEGVSGHSTRVGAAQDMVAYGIELPAIMQAGRWKSMAIANRRS